MQKASYYRQLNNKICTCELCPHRCTLTSGQTGRCGVRRNVDGVLISLCYGQISSIAIDPIEKKPFFQYLPGTYALSIGSYGCNLRCPWCQNYQISRQKPPHMRVITPQQVIDLAVHYHLPSIAYTYNEPVINYEFVLETATLAYQKGIKNILVTNGYLQHQPLVNLLPYIGALNIDLKMFDEKMYQHYCGASLKPVLHTIQVARTYAHVEVTTLIVTDVNDQESSLLRLVQWLAALDDKIPLHLNRYFPCYNYHQPATDASFVTHMVKLARRYLQFVYAGNMA